eukprot:2408558-Lingulodinium_polyedra.AAC.1
MQLPYTWPRTNHSCRCTPRHRIKEHASLSLVALTAWNLRPAVAEAGPHRPRPQPGTAGPR